MADVVETNGTDITTSYDISSGAVKGFLDNAGKFPYLNLSDKEGMAKFTTYVNDYLLAKEYNGMAFADGEGVKMLVADPKATAMDFPIMGQVPISMRTTKVVNGTTDIKKGTTNNGGLLSQRKPVVLSDSAVRMYFNHRWDRRYFIPEEQAEMLNVDNFTQQVLDAIASGVAFSKSATIVAQHLEAGLNRGVTDTDSIVSIGKDKISTEGYIKDKMAQLISLLDNPKDGYESGIVSYAKKGEIIVIKASKASAIFSKKSGLMDYGDLSNLMLGNASFDPNKRPGTERERFNCGFRLNVLFKVLPDVYFDKAIKLLSQSLSGNTTELSKIYGYIAHEQGTQFGVGKDKIEINRNTDLDNMGNDIKTCIKWGSMTARPNSVALLVEGAKDGTTDFVNPATADAPAEIIAPENWDA